MLKCHGLQYCCEPPDWPAWPSERPEAKPPACSRQNIARCTPRAVALFVYVQDRHGQANAPSATLKTVGQAGRGSEVAGIQELRQLLLVASFRSWALGWPEQCRDGQSAEAGQQSGVARTPRPKAGSPATAHEHEHDSRSHEKTSWQSAQPPLLWPLPQPLPLPLRGGSAGWQAC